MSKIVSRVVLFLVLATAVTLTGGCASDVSARDPKEQRSDNEHEFHTNQEHYDRGGVIGPK